MTKQKSKSKRSNAIVVYQAPQAGIPKKKRRVKKKHLQVSKRSVSYGEQVLAFLHCLMDPFDWRSWGGSAKVPTGHNAMTLAIRDQLELTIKPDANGNVLFLVKPGLPCAVVIYNGKFVTSGDDGVNHNYDVSAFGNGGDATGVGVPFPDWPVVPATASSVPLWNSRKMQKARAISCAFKVSPVGPPVAVAGVSYIASVPLPTYAHSFHPVTLGAGGTHTKIVVDGNPYQLSKEISVGKATDYPGMSADSIGTFPGAKMCPVNESCFGMVRIPPAAREHFTPVSPGWRGFGNDGTTPVVGDTTLEVSALVGSSDVEVEGNNTQAYYGDEVPNWVTAPTAPPPIPVQGLAPTGNVWTYPGDEAIAYACTGLPADFPLLLTVVQCTEAEMSAQSSHRQYMAPSPPDNPSALQTATNIVRKIPTVIPMIGEGGSLLQSILNTAGDLRTVIAGLGFGQEPLHRQLRALRM